MSSLKPPSPEDATPLAELAKIFLRLGATSFGGPASHIALMHEEVVRRRQWLTEEEFLDLLSAANLIPGPNSTELAIHIGHRRAGWPGLLVAGTAFILPAALIVTAVAWAYRKFGVMPEARAILYGVEPIVVAVVLHAIWGLSRSALKTRFLVLLGLLAFSLSLLGVNELAVLFGGGLAALLFLAARRQHRHNLILFPLAWLVSFPSTSAIVSLSALFLVFAKIGSVLFGSGYVLLAFLQAELVERRAWLTSKQLLDAVAVGQITPGPVFTTATFIGYILAGLSGAAVATLGIFLPAFLFVAISGPLVPRLRRSASSGAFLDGLNAASLGLMAAVTVHLGHAALVDLLTISIAALSALALFRFRINATYLVVAGAILGLLHLWWI